MLTAATTTAIWILAAIFCSIYAEAKTDIQHGPKYKMYVLAKRKQNYGCFLLGYVITLNCLTNNYQVKH